MENNFQIYKITNLVTGKSYIGQTINNLNQRWNKHKVDAKNGVGYFLHRAIRKYKISTFKIEVIAHAMKREALNDLEITLIAQHGTLTPNGYNLTTGGLAKTKISEETKKKISQARKGRKHTETTKRKIGEASRGNTFSLGHKHSEEAKKKMSQNNSKSRGLVVTPFGIFKNTLTAGKSCNCYSMTVSRRCNNSKPQWSGWYYEEQLGDLE